MKCTASLVSLSIAEPIQASAIQACMRVFGAACRTFISAAILSLALIGSGTSQPADRFTLSSAVPTSGFPANVAIDIVAHDGGIWLATGKGVVYSSDNGLTWRYFDSTTGLTSSSISALFSEGNRIWTATNRDTFVTNQLVSSSDGVSYLPVGSTDWTRINFTSSGQNIPFVLGGNRTVFDITGAQNQLLGPNDDWLFFASFAGGFLASRDGGTTWRRVYPSASDSSQFNAGGEPSLRNRYFSCVADSSHGDSLFVWAGTAGGIFQFVYVLPREKLSIDRFFASVPCNGCSDSNRLYIGGQGGISIGKKRGGPFTSRFVSDGLVGNRVTAIASIGDRVIAATADSATGVSTGLTISTNGGDSFTPLPIPALAGTDRVINSFAQIGSRLYLAASQAGLYSSIDSGQSWTRILLDSVNTTSTVNAANALFPFGDTMFVGTDSGIASLFLAPTGEIDSARQFFFPEDSLTSSRVIQINLQLSDTNVIWIATRPRTSNGTAAVLASRDRGLTWLLKEVPVTSDFAFLGDSIVLATDFGPRLLTSINASTNTTFAVVDSTNASLTMATDSVYHCTQFGDTLIIGSRQFLAFSVNRGKKFRLFRPNFDPLGADVVVNHTFLSTISGSDFGIPGDFIPALAVQYRSGAPADVWVSGRPVDAGGNGISRGRYQSSGALDFDIVYEEDFAWNFGFAGDTAFAASNSGLLRYVGTVWDTVALQSGGTPLVDPGTAVFAVQPIASNIWVGTGDGLVRIDRTNGTLTNQQLYGVADSTSPADQVYAFPVPFSPGSGGTLDFHFVVEQAGRVTLEVYDFAMNLVARPIDNLAYAAGIYPSGSSQGVTWDGRNGKGETVAVGIYYFKVTIDSGTPRWGKLAVIP